MVILGLFPSLEQAREGQEQQVPSPEILQVLQDPSKPPALLDGCRILGLKGLSGAGAEDPQGSLTLTTACYAFR